MDEPNQNWTGTRIETWALSKSKRKCGAIIFALVWISKVVFTQLCANVVFFLFSKFSKSFDAAVQRTLRRFCLFACFLLLFLFGRGECLFNELNWKVNTPSVTKWLVWAHSCQVFPRLNTIFHLCFCACTVIRFAMYIRRWRGWQVIALHELCLCCWMFNMYQKSR